MRRFQRVMVCAAVLLAGSTVATAGVCADAEQNAWVRSCAWALDAVERGERPRAQDPWKIVDNTDSLFAVPLDLAEQFVAACYDLLAQPDRVPETAAAWLASSGWPPTRNPCSRDEHQAWLRACEEDAAALPGQTRSELLVRFRTEGGLSTWADRTFLHRRCEYWKVRVHFSLVDEHGESAGDLVQTSSSYIGSEMMD
jgi:hypothetical protein